MVEFVNRRTNRCRTCDQEYYRPVLVLVERDSDQGAGRNAPRRNPPRHRDHGRCAGQRRLLRPRARPAARQEDGQPGRPDRLPPLLCRRARLAPAPTSRSSSTRARGAAARGPAWCTASSGASPPRRRSTSGGAARGEGIDRRARDGPAPLRGSRGARPRARRRRDGRRAARRGAARRSRASSRSRASTACGLHARSRAEPRASSRTRSASSPRGEHDWEARGEQRGGFYAYDAPPAERGVPGAGTVHHVAWSLADGRARRVAAAGARGGRARRRRSSTASTSARSTSASRAACCSRSRRIGPGFTRTSRSSTSASASSLPPDFEHLREQIEPVLTPLRTRARPGPSAERPRLPGRAPAAGEPEGALVLFHGRGADENDLFPLLDALDPERRLLGVTPRGPLSLPPGGAHWYASASSATPTRHVPADRTARAGLARRARGRVRHSAGADRPRRLLAGRGDELRARARERTPAPGGDRRAQRLHPDRRRASSSTSSARCRRSRSATAPTTR